MNNQSLAPLCIRCLVLGSILAVLNAPAYAGPSTQDANKVAISTLRRDIQALRGANAELDRRLVRSETLSQSLQKRLDSANQELGVLKDKKEGPDLTAWLGLLLAFVSGGIAVTAIRASNNTASQQRELDTKLNKQQGELDTALAQRGEEWDGKLKAYELFKEERMRQMNLAREMRVLAQGMHVQSATYVSVRSSMRKWFHEGQGDSNPFTTDADAAKAAYTDSTTQLQTLADHYGKADHRLGVDIQHLSEYIRRWLLDMYALMENEAQAEGQEASELRDKRNEQFRALTTLLDNAFVLDRIELIETKPSDRIAPFR